MPTENRSSNTENAPCPFCGGNVDPEGWLNGTGQRGPECEGCGATAPSLALWNAARPAQQHQGEPVTLPARKPEPTELSDVFVDAGNEFWNACLDEIAKLGPLYTHADPAEFERLRDDLDECDGDRWKLRTERNLLRAQLAEAHALLREASTVGYALPADWFNRYAALSASVEPSAPADWNLPELTDDLREILGRPNFTCHFIAKALRIMGHNIAPKSEDEQAVVIHWLLGYYLKHGADWRQRAEAELKAASEKLKA